VGYVPRRKTVQKILTYVRPLSLVAAVSLVALVLAAVPVVVVSVAHGDLSALAFAAVVTLFVVGCLAGAAAWVAGLIVAAGIRRWDWFVAVLLLGAPAALALGIANVKIQPAADRR
jgi:hypothetical protein